MLHVLVIYDISDDRIRTKVADMCLNYGLDRVQNSAFVGQLPRGLQEELMLRIEKLLGSETGIVQLIAVNPKDWANRIEVCNA
ncbi:MAG: CRISPR-associated endonuclease Cas2 [Anaerolineae bacterium]|nr:CRISPR-associated endonuclease Cas2 [Anaerolineae bacterium]MDW8300537.1 CRISPR-associated endonuclease Cas2 [Anaerolineae bacterium]